jgi:hypothetical protein
MSDTDETIDIFPTVLLFDDDTLQKALNYAASKKSKPKEENVSNAK